MSTPDEHTERLNTERQDVAKEWPGNFIHHRAYFFWLDLSRLNAPGYPRHPPIAVELRPG